MRPLKLPGIHRLRQLEVLEPRLLLTGNVPDAVDDLSETPQETAVIVEVLANDVSENPGDMLRVSNFEQAAHGTVSENDDGTLTYLPDIDFFGDDHFDYTVSDGSGRSDTASVVIRVMPSYYFTLIDFGATQESNFFGVAYWDSMIKDTYARYTAAGPGGLYQLGSSAAYNYQGITGPERTFYEGEKIIVSWYNDSDTAITFTPKVSLDDTNRRVSSPSGTWYDMQSVTIEPGNSGATEFTIDAVTAGEYATVNVNSNAYSSFLVIDKIELVPVRVHANLVDYGAQPSEDFFDVAGWNSVIKDIYARNTERRPWRRLSVWWQLQL